MLSDPNVGFSIVASVDKFAVSVKANSLTVGKEYFLETTSGTRDSSWTHVSLVYDPTFQSSEKILHKLETKILTTQIHVTVRHVIKLFNHVIKSSR